MFAPIHAAVFSWPGILRLRTIQALSWLLFVAACCTQNANAGFWGNIKKALNIDNQSSSSTIENSTPPSKPPQDVMDVVQTVQPSSSIIAGPKPAQDVIDVVQTVQPSSSIIAGQKPAQDVIEVVHASDIIAWSSATVIPPSLASTVVDSVTGLMWMRCSLGQTWVNQNCTGDASTYTWNEARILKHSFAGHQDWRLPTIRELQTLVEPGTRNPAINSEIHPSTPSSGFWSGTPSTFNSIHAWYVSFYNGYSNTDIRSMSKRVRLVRGGQSLAILSEPEDALKAEIEKLIHNRIWSVSEETNYARMAEANLRRAQSVHHELPSHLQATYIQLRTAPSPPPKLIKNEFETSADFHARISTSRAAYEVKVADYNRQVVDYERQVKDYYAHLGPLPDEKRHQAIRSAFLNSYGAPRLSNLRYEADTQSFYALISTEDGSYLGKQIVLRDIPPDQARKLKPALEAARPEVYFRINADNSLTWGVINLQVGQHNLVAVSVNSVDEAQRVEVAINALDVANPNIAAPQPIILHEMEFDIRSDPTIAAQQAEIDRVKRQRAQAKATFAEQQRLKEELARLQQSTPLNFNDDLPLLLARAPAAKSDKHLHVMAIGIGDYADVADVPFADRSATLFADLAKKTLGALPENIITLTNNEATSGRLRGRLRTLLGRLSKEDRLLIYFAGHGVPAQDGNSVFLLAQDGGPGSYEESDLQLNTLYERVSRSRVGQAQLFIDACFSGRSNKDSMILGGTGGVAIVPKHGIRADSRLTVMIAGRAEQLSNQHEAHGHRLFGYHLMHAMLNDGLKLSAGELHSKIRGKVLADSLRLGPEFEQEPELLGNPAALLKR